MDQFSYNSNLELGVILRLSEFTLSTNHSKVPKNHQNYKQELSILLMVLEKSKLKADEPWGKKDEEVFERYKKSLKK